MFSMSFIEYFFKLLPSSSSSSSKSFIMAISMVLFVLIKLAILCMSSSLCEEKVRIMKIKIIMIDRHLRCFSLSDEYTANCELQTSRDDFLAGWFHGDFEFFLVRCDDIGVLFHVDSNSS
jgi:hypothetical protein